MIVARIIALLIGYGFGLFQTGYLYGKSKGIDIRQQGSGNAGTTNSLRVLGWKAGIITFAGDLLKAVFAVLLVKLIFHGTYGADTKVLELYAGFGTVLGHNFPCYLQFRGGKGIACTTGVILAVCPPAVICCAVGFLIIVGITRYVSVGSIFLVSAYLVQAIIFGQIGWLKISGASRIGADHFYDYFEQFGLLHKTGIDLPGEASTIMHKREKIGLVELATISFGQSFQITPIQLATTVSSIINGGNRVTPHVGMQVENGDKKVIKTFDFPVQEGICREETSEKMRFLLEKVVSEGGGNKAYIEGYEIGGKTATSQTLPRSAHKYISSFLGFAPADDPKVLVLVIIRNPSGVYYGGTIAAPVAKEIFENILPYLELEQ